MWVLAPPTSSLDSTYCSLPPLPLFTWPEMTCLYFLWFSSATLWTVHVGPLSHQRALLDNCLPSKGGMKGCLEEGPCSEFLSRFSTFLGTLTTLTHKDQDCLPENVSTLRARKGQHLLDLFPRAAQTQEA